MPLLNYGADGLGIIIGGRMLYRFGRDRLYPSSLAAQGEVLNQTLMSEVEELVNRYRSTKDPSEQNSVKQLLKEQLINGLADRYLAQRASERVWRFRRPGEAVKVDRAVSGATKLLEKKIDDLREDGISKKLWKKINGSPDKEAVFSKGETKEILKQAGKRAMTGRIGSVRRAAGRLGLGPDMPMRALEQVLKGTNLDPSLEASSPPSTVELWRQLREVEAEMLTTTTAITERERRATELKEQGVSGELLHRQNERAENRLNQLDDERTRLQRVIDQKEGTNVKVESPLRARALGAGEQPVPTAAAQQSPSTPPSNTAPLVQTQPEGNVVPIVQAGEQQTPAPVPPQPSVTASGAQGPTVNNTTAALGPPVPPVPPAQRTPASVPAQQTITANGAQSPAVENTAPALGPNASGQPPVQSWAVRTAQGIGRNGSTISFGVMAVPGALELSDALRHGDLKKAKEAAKKEGALVGAAAAPKLVQSGFSAVGAPKLLAGAAGGVTLVGLGGYFTYVSAYATAGARQAQQNAAAEIKKLESQIPATKNDPQARRALKTKLDTAWNDYADSTYAKYTSGIDSLAAGLATTSGGLALTGVGATAAVVTGTGAAGLGLVSAGNHLYGWWKGQEGTRGLGFKILELGGEKPDYKGLSAGEPPAIKAPGNLPPTPVQERALITATIRPEAEAPATLAGRQLAALYQRSSFNDLGAGQRTVTDTPKVTV
jgi:hypothetical protein